MRKTFTIKFVIMGKTYKRDDYPFADLMPLCNLLETILEILDTNPEDRWEDKFMNRYGLIPCEEDERAAYTFYFDKTGLYDNDHNLIVSMKDRMTMWRNPDWFFDASEKDYRKDPLKLAVPESMEDGKKMMKRLLKSSLEILRETE